MEIGTDVQIKGYYTYNSIIEQQQVVLTIDLSEDSGAR